MTRDHSTNPSQRVISKPNSYNHHHQHHHHNHQTKVVQFKPFCLFSHDDKSLRQAVELVESASLNRFRVCVVSVIGKDSLDESVKNHLIRSLFTNQSNRHDTNSHKKRQKGKAYKSRDDETKASELIDCPATTNSTCDLDDSQPSNEHENQVLGEVDSSHGVILLNLTSFLETDKLCSLDQIVASLNNDQQLDEQPILSDIWPRWNQNLIKTMLILMIMSHIVVLYNTEPCIDYSLIQIFKILEILRLKSQTRVTDLLETIASKQMFPSQWIRQGRVSCPRALFVCDTTYLDVSITQFDVVNLKRDLEDQIYRLLKKTDVVSSTASSKQSNGLSSAPLFCLPERDDFVFVVTRQDLQSGYKSDRFNRAGLKVLKELRKEDIYSDLIKSLRIGESDHDQNDFAVVEDVSLITSAPFEHDLTEGGQPESQPSSAKPNLSPHNRFKKFLYKHISSIQASAQSEIDNKHHLGPTRQVNLVLPRYDDFFTVLIHLRNLLFPQVNLTEGDSSNEQSVEARKSDNWLKPDERRFVDIYDLVNTDRLFSELHCYKTRLAAFNFYQRDLQASPNMLAHEQSSQAARKLYLNHARGSACLTQLGQLSEQCQRHWQNLGHPKLAGDDVKYGRLFRGANVTRSFASGVTAHSSVQRSSSTSPSGLTTDNKNKANLSILRRANGIKMIACCDCGRRSNYMITPVDRKKKLERVDIHRLND